MSYSAYINNFDRESLYLQHRTPTRLALRAYLHYTSSPIVQVASVDHLMLTQPESRVQCAPQLLVIPRPLRPARRVTAGPHVKGAMVYIFWRKWFIREYILLVPYIPLCALA